MRHRFVKEFIRCCATIVLGFLLGGLLCIFLTLAGCKSKHVVERIEVPVITTQEHTIEKVRVEHTRDTLIQRDSVYHYIKGDTTIIERWHYLQSTGQLIKVDTLIKVDSVQVPVEVVREKLVTEVKEVPRPFSWWQKTLMIIGCSAMIAVLLLISYKIRKR